MTTSINASAKCDVRVSSCIFKAAHMLHTNLGIDVSGAMKLAGYSKREIAKRNIRKSEFEKKTQFLLDKNVKR